MTLGKMGHVGIVVKDLQAAKEHYSRLLGIKKWYELVYDGGLDMIYNGEKRNCNVTLYFGGKGKTAVELIYTEGDENIYTTFLKNKSEGIHHIEYNVKDLDAAVADAEKEGLKVIQCASFESKGSKIRYAYVGRSENDTIFEFVETVLPFANMRKVNPPFEAKLAVLTGNYKLVK